MNQKAIFVVVSLVVVVFLGSYYFGKANAPKPTITPTPTVTATLPLYPTDNDVPTMPPTGSILPTVSTTGTATPTPTSAAVKFLKVISEKPTEGAGSGNYKYSFLKCSDSHCDHYLLTPTLTSGFPILATVEADMDLPFMITTNTKELGVAAGNTYLEMTSLVEVYLGTTYEGVSSDMGDGKSYHVFSACSAKWSVCRKYLLDTTKASSTLKSLLVDSRKGKMAYISSKVTEGGAAAGTGYWYMTTGITVYFK